MTDEPEDFEREFEKLSIELEMEIQEGIEEAAALCLCFPLSEVGNDSLARLKEYARENPQIFWTWISETFPKHEHYWKGQLERATEPEQPESASK